ncbi:MULTISPECIES: hypothetical protein [unclassified Thioalkalivibrio]|uniref:hypothetical protein n=1 Tax=unclassified Thioalkalivibrio TaxID=2621013 RepID=UPI000369CBEF|nr:MULTISPECIES: hypothetical protein [unclassified Thioalkalivibrio]
MTNLTENEIKALESCLNYEDRETQLSDNYSNGDPAVFRKVLGWDKHQVAGLISSLEQKGMGFHDEEDGIFWLSVAGVHAIFDVLEARERGE